MNKNLIRFCKFKSIEKEALAMSITILKKFLTLLPDKLYLKIRFYKRLGKRLNLKNPKTYNEKLQWLKLYDRNPLYQKMVDKYDVRKYVSDKIGEEYLIPLIGLYHDFDEIDFKFLPNQFVIKCTHDSGGIVICKDKRQFNLCEAREKIIKCLKRNYYYQGREYAYKNLHPRIIVEEYMVDESRNELKDYKFFCFNGIPKSFSIISGRGENLRLDSFDVQFNSLPFCYGYRSNDKKIEKPKGLSKMIEVAKILSANIPHVRIDLYDVNGKVYFGEITFFSGSGCEKFNPHKYDEIFGSWLELPVHN